MYIEGHMECTDYELLGWPNTLELPNSVTKMITRLYRRENAANWPLPGPLPGSNKL